MNLNLYNLNPKYIYLNANSQRSELSKELKNKPGIYLWYNKVSNNFYVGSAKDLNNRLARYYRPSELIRVKSSLIYRALMLYGHTNFSLIILETCSIKDLIEREQYYLNLFTPMYNILKFAASSKPGGACPPGYPPEGKVYEYFDKSRLLMSPEEPALFGYRPPGGRSKIKKDPFIIKHILKLASPPGNTFVCAPPGGADKRRTKMSEEFRKLRSELTKGSLNPNFGKGNKVKAFDKELNTFKVYSSVSNCAKSHNTTRSSIRYSIKNYTLYKGRYYFKYV